MIARRFHLPLAIFVLGLAITGAYRVHMAPQLESKRTEISALQADITQRQIGKAQSTHNPLYKKLLTGLPSDTVIQQIAKNVAAQHEVVRFSVSISNAQTLGIDGKDYSAKTIQLTFIAPNDSTARQLWLDLADRLPIAAQLSTLSLKRESNGSINVRIEGILYGQM